MADGDVFIGQILLVPFNFPPKDYAFCRGQILVISQNTALFSLLGTTYGGDGKTTFALPNLQGAVPMGSGHGPGLTDRLLGEMGGSETVALTTAEIPAHAHGLTGSAGCLTGPGNQQTPVGNVPAAESSGATATFSSAPADAMMRAGNIAFSGSVTTGANGGDQGHQNRQPYLALSYCIALQGIFPARP